MVNSNLPNNLPERPELTVPVKIYFYDTDAGGVVHNVAYLRLIEQARSELAEHLGWSLAEMGQGACPVVARTEIDYLKPARLGDVLEIRGRMVEVGRVKFVLAFEVVRPSDGALIARCRQEMVTVDLKSGRPVRLREDWRKRWPQCAS
jgi:YbgC/YbaW family acyl-CoA thioester hydrolase